MKSLEEKVKRMQEELKKKDELINSLKKQIESYTSLEGKEISSQLARLLIKIQTKVKKLREINCLLAEKLKAKNE